MKKLVGISLFSGNNGVVKATLYVLGDFDSYLNDSASGRVAKGQSAEAIYVGSVDVSGLKIGDNIEIAYGKAVRMKDGNIFQPVQSVRVIK